MKSEFSVIAAAAAIMLVFAAVPLLTPHFTLGMK